MPDDVGLLLVVHELLLLATGEGEAFACDCSYQSNDRFSAAWTLKEAGVGVAREQEVLHLFH